MGMTMYSGEVQGDKGNFEWVVSFDKTGKRGSTKGYLGITQLEEGKVTDRVLLSIDQVKELQKFLRKKINTSMF